MTDYQPTTDPDRCPDAIRGDRRRDAIRCDLPVGHLDAGWLHEYDDGLGSVYHWGPMDAHPREPEHLDGCYTSGDFALAAPDPQTDATRHQRAYAILRDMEEDKALPLTKDRLLALAGVTSYAADRVGDTDGGVHAAPSLDREQLRDLIRHAVAAYMEADKVEAPDSILEAVADRMTDAAWAHWLEARP